MTRSDHAAKRAINVRFTSDYASAPALAGRTAGTASRFLFRASMVFALAAAYAIAEQFIR